MPIYEYSCSKCSHLFEEWQKDFVDRKLECPECGAVAKRLISNTAFILKGSGWYVTDYADNGKRSNGEQGTDEAKAKSNGDQTAEKSNGASPKDNGGPKTEKTAESAQSGTKTEGSTESKPTPQSESQ